MVDDCQPFRFSLLSEGEGEGGGGRLVAEMVDIYCIRAIPVGQIYYSDFMHSKCPPWSADTASVTKVINNSSF